ncbi:hypothetical protein [Alteromonas facilis]|uniref:hypothetical protein n=1 Tax=Alteromonas facilis TaxID=2048004 RepID=UPI000C28E3EE|nr:hypothetical protein [Alteromonas facilis]
MNRLGILGITGLLLLTSLPTWAQSKISQTQLKQSAVTLCSQAAVETYGEEAIVAINNRVEWHRPVSRLSWHDGLGASVRIVLKVEESNLSRVVCLVDQRHNVSLLKDGEASILEAGLLTAKQ